MTQGYQNGSISASVDLNLFGKLITRRCAKWLILKATAHDGGIGIQRRLKKPPSQKNIGIKDVRVQVRPDKFNEVLGLVSFAVTVAAWGWTVIAPDSSMWFGSGLLFVAVLSVLAAIFRLWPTGIVKGTFLVIAVLSGFGTFDWYVVIKPQKGKEFKVLLVEGYHVSDECSLLPAKDDMPEWIRDQSARWQTRTESAITDKLTYRDIQMWRGSGVIGLVKDKNMNAYQCLSLGNKIMVLETIIAEHFDSKLMHVKYKGPTYWLNVQDGKADITEALQAGAGSADVYINSNGDTKDGKVQIEGHFPPATPPPSQK